VSEGAAQTRVRLLEQLGTITASPRVPGAAAGVLSPVLRDKLTAFHKRYQATYVEDAQRTVRPICQKRPRNCPPVSTVLPESTPPLKKARARK